MRTSAIMAAVLLAAALMGCTDIREWSYEADARTVRAPVLAKRVVVPPLNDLRPPRNRNIGVLLVYFVPLMPYGTAEYNKPERLPIWEMKGVAPCDPKHDVAKAIARELDYSGLFRKVDYVPYPYPSPYARGAGLVLQGDLIALKENRWHTLYGLTYFFGDFLWLLGAPVGGIRHELTLKLTLVDVDTGRTLWTETFSEYVREMEWIYRPKYALRHPALLKTEMRQAITSLERALSK